MSNEHDDPRAMDRKASCCSLPFMCRTLPECMPWQLALSVCLFVAAKPGQLLLLSSLFALAFGTSQALNNGSSGERLIKEGSNRTSDKCTSSFGSEIRCCYVLRKWKKIVVRPLRICNAVLQHRHGRREIGRPLD